MENPVYGVLLSTRQTEALVVVSEAFDDSNGSLTAADGLAADTSDADETQEAGAEESADEAAEVKSPLAIPAPPRQRYVSAIEHQAIRDKRVELHPTWPPTYEPFTENQTVPWIFTRLALSQLDELGISAVRVVNMMEGEHVINQSANSDATNHFGDDLHVLLDGNGEQIISVLARETHATYGSSGVAVISGEGQPANRKKSHRGGPGRTIPSTVKEFIALLDSHGFETTQGGGGHYKATHPDHPTVIITVPATPSDARAFLNTVADIRRLTGIDISRPAAT